MTIANSYEREGSVVRLRYMRTIGEDVRMAQCVCSY